MKKRKKHTRLKKGMRTVLRRVALKRVGAVLMALLLFFSVISWEMLFVYDSRTSANSSGAATAEITQAGYIWENDDGTSADTNTQLMPGSTMLHPISKGGRATLRMQIKNTGSANLTSKDIGLFYDRYDGIWTKVQSSEPPVTGNGTGCGDTDWSCGTIDNAGVTEHMSVAVNGNGIPHIAYMDSAANDLYLATYVGRGGNCTDTAWRCALIEDTGTAGAYASIGINRKGGMWIAYHEDGSDDLWVAKYVGTGGSGCATAAWSCTSIDTTGDVGKHAAISFQSVTNADCPAISYFDATNSKIKLATSSGAACTTWGTTTIDAAGTGGKTSLAYDPAGFAWISYYDQASQDLNVARQVSAGGSGCSDGGSTWSCVGVDTANTVGSYNSIAIGPDGDPAVAYHYVNSSDVRYAEFVGSGGAGCASGAWTCTTVKTTDVVGGFVDLAFSPSGQPWISYRNDTTDDVEVARFVGSGGSGCATATWHCEGVINIGTNGTGASIAFSPNGNAWITGRESGSSQLTYGKIHRQGEITAAAGMAASVNAAMSESHADMTTTTDTGNRDDADCIGGGTWTNGRWISGEAHFGVTLNASNCTELSWVLDTSQANLSNYRFIVATGDNTDAGRQYWRGPAVITHYAELGVTGAPDVRYSKGIFSESPELCYGSSPWACETVWDKPVITNPGMLTGIAVDQTGKKWVAFYSGAIATSVTDLYVAEYVGSGGNCTGNAAWQCTVIDATDAAQVGFLGQPTIRIGPDGRPWVAYRRDPSNRVGAIAHYVGSGGNCPNSSAWQCEDYAASTFVSSYVHVGLEFDKTGTPIIVYGHYSSSSNVEIYMARRDGAGAGNCSNTNWTCTKITDTPVSSNNLITVNLALDKDGVPWIEWGTPGNGGGTQGIYVAQYIGGGGSCTNTAWNCTRVTNNVDTGEQPMTSMVIDGNNKPWIAFRRFSTNRDLFIAEYVGSGGNCTDAAWNGCAAPLDTSATWFNKMAVDAAGKPWVVTAFSVSTVKAYQYVGDGTGTGCSSGSTAWNCTFVENLTASSQANGPDIAFDRSGTPWITYGSDGADTEIARLPTHFDSMVPTSTFNTSFNGKNGRTFGGHVLLDIGQSPRSSSPSQCLSTADKMGYCGVVHADGGYDSITTQRTYEKPYYIFAIRFQDNASFPNVKWVGRSSLAPNTGGTTGDLYMQIYRFSGTVGWATLDSETAASNCNTADCTLEAMPATGSPSEYYTGTSGDYWMYVRVYQVESSSTASFTLKTDGIQVTRTDQQMRHGGFTRDGVEAPLNW